MECHSLWGHFKVWVLEACDEVCGMKRGWGSKGDTWWWNEVVKEAILMKKDAHKMTCQNNAEENRKRY